jgi:hypothetical protein
MLISICLYSDLFLPGLCRGGCVLFLLMMDILQVLAEGSAFVFVSLKVVPSDAVVVDVAVFRLIVAACLRSDLFILRLVCAGYCVARWRGACDQAWASVFAQCFCLWGVYSLFGLPVSVCPGISVGSSASIAVFPVCRAHFLSSFVFTLGALSGVVVELACCLAPAVQECGVGVT